MSRFPCLVLSLAVLLSGCVSPLAKATVKGEIAKVKGLLDRGAKVNAKSYGDRTALWLAVHEGQLEIARLLLDRGADPNIACPRSGVGQGPADDTRQPLGRASERGQLAMVQLLLDRGADIKAALINKGSNLFSESV